MASEVISIRLTQAEIELLDRIYRQENYESRSDFIRNTWIGFAKEKGLQAALVGVVEREREIVPIRRSAKLCKLIGPRTKRVKGL